MPEARFRVQVERDHLDKLATARPIQALSELVWNSLDADATRVDIEIDTDEVAMRAVTVRDNGHGIPHSDVETLFGKLGGSWKRHGARSKAKGRNLHGKEGKGRLKALALGRSAVWSVRYLQDGKLMSYTISLLRDDLVDVRVTEPIEAEPALGTGVEVRITELDRTYRSLEPRRSVQALSEVFALYLTDYSEAGVYVESEKLDPSSQIAERRTLDLEPIVAGDKEHAVQVELIEWKAASERWFFLCGPEGFPFLRTTPRFHTPGYQFSAYLRSSYVDVLQEAGVLELSEMDPALQEACDAAAELIKAHFRDKEVESSKTEIEQWKTEEIYPYRSEPQTSVAKAERKVFDIVALNVNRLLPEFSQQSAKSRAFQLRMLRQAIERGPDELQHILTEVLDLPERAQREMSKLLEEADLANVISASRLVSDRLKFVHGLEALLFDADSRKHLKERSQLHRMIAENNTWLFGEEFSLTVDDKSLTEVLRQHQKAIGSNTVIDDGPVKRIDGKKGIVDLMLSRAVPQSRAEEREHLVVELKRPSVKVGAEEIMQAKKYAFSISEDERFRHVKTRWSFWVISNELDSFARHETRQKDAPPGRVHLSEHGNVEVWVKSWAEVLNGCKARLQFVQNHLQANVDRESSLRYLKKTYDKYLSGVADDHAMPKEEIDKETLPAK